MKKRDADLEQRLVPEWQQAIPNDRMAHLLKDTSRVLTKALQARLAKHDVLIGHWTYLRILWEKDGLTKRQISREAAVSEPTTFVALRAMETLGLIRLEQRADNQKNIYVYLTANGKRLKKSLMPMAEKVNAQAFNGISAVDAATARTVLLKMMANFDASE